MREMALEVWKCRVRRFCGAGPWGAEETLIVHLAY